jgi:hypothetical protein
MPRDEHVCVGLTSVFTVVAMLYRLFADDHIDALYFSLVQDVEEVEEPEEPEEDKTKDEL